MPDVKHIDSDEQLASLCQSLLSTPVLAVDTEFIRTDTFYPIPALVQLFDGKTCYLIDPLRITDVAPLAELMACRGVIKVMHSCSEDMEVFQTLLQRQPEPLVDTQIAAGLAGLEFSISYQNLVLIALGRSLEKDETRSDWLQRPLTEKQLAYAADDVLWLLDVYQFLHQRLDALDRLRWLQEECEAVVNRARQPVQDNDYYLRIRAAKKLDSRQLHVLRALSSWREQEARKTDVPRSRVASDAELVDLVYLLPRDKYALSAKSKLSPRSIRRHGETILEIIVTSLEDDDIGHPPLLAASDGGDERIAIKKMKAEAGKVAKQLQLQTEVLARRKELEAYFFASDPADTVLGSGWRKQYLDDVLAPLRKQYRNGKT